MQSGGDFNPAEIYQRDAPGVVTVLSIFGAAGRSRSAGRRARARAS